MPSLRLIDQQGADEQGVEEEIVYTVDCSLYGANSTDPLSTISVKVYSVDEDADPNTLSEVTSTVMPINTPVAVDQVITFSKLKSLTDGVLYRIDLKFTKGGNVFTPYGLIRGRR